MMPRFDTPVPPGGYRWWYIDGLSDDGRHGITLIAFVGRAAPTTAPMTTLKRWTRAVASVMPI